MSTVLLDITQALDIAVLDVLTGAVVKLDKADVAMPNVKFTPAAGKPHARVDHLHATTSAATAGVNGLTLRPGILQVRLYWPEGGGLGAPMRAAQALVDTFKRGATFTRGTTAVRMQRASINTYLKEGEWLVLPVSLDWRVYAQD